MQSSQLQSLWATACAVAALLANWVGGFSMVVTAVFAVLLLTGAILIGRDDPADEAEPSDDDAQVYPYEDEVEVDEAHVEAPDTEIEADVDVVEAEVVEAEVVEADVFEPEVDEMEAESTDFSDSVEARPAVGTSHATL